MYRRHLRPDGTSSHYARVGRLATVGLMVVSGVITYYIKSVEGAWKFLLAIGAGTGLVYLLRWYWWRINAWSELVAMGASFVVSIAVWRWGHLSADDPLALVITVALTTVAWVAATFLTRPESAETLERFYARTRPGGPGWRVVAARLGFGGDRIPGGALSWVNWVAGWVAVYATLFGIGQLFVGTAGAALGFGVVAAGAFALIARNLRRDAGFRSGTVDTGSVAA